MEIKNYPVDVQKESTPTIKAAADNVLEVSSDGKNPPKFDRKQSYKNLLLSTTLIEPLTLPQSIELIRDAEVSVYVVYLTIVEANASVPETGISPTKKCACGSTTHLHRSNGDCPLHPKAEQKKESSINILKEQSHTSLVVVNTSRETREIVPISRISCFQL